LFSVINSKMFQLQGDAQLEELKNNTLIYARKKLESLNFDEEKFPKHIFHHAKGIGIIHLKQNFNEKNIGYGIIFTHWKSNEKKACGPLFINLTIGNANNNNNNGHIMHELCPKSDNLLLIFKEESQIYQIVEEKNHEICLGIDYNIEGIVKDDYDAILCYQIINHELCPIDNNINLLRGCCITLNDTEMKSFYGNNKITAHDVYCGTAKMPINGDYLKAEQYMHSKLMTNFGQVHC